MSRARWDLDDVLGPPSAAELALDQAEIDHQRRKLIRDWPTDAEGRRRLEDLGEPGPDKPDLPF